MNNTSSTKQKILGSTPSSAATQSQPATQPTAQPTGTPSPAPEKKEEVKPIQKPEGIKTLRAPAQQSKPDRLISYEEQYRRLNTSPELTPEEKEKQRKTENAKAIISGVSDGLAALSNLYFTTQYAPSMYDGSKTMSAANKIRYDKMMSDQEAREQAYNKGLYNAAAKDMQYMREQIKAKQEQDAKNEQIKYDREKDKNDLDYKIKKDAADRKAANDRNDADNATRRAIAEGRNAATAARGVRGKQLGFADGEGKQVSIYENVWKGSMQTVYDTLVEEMKELHDNGQGPRVPRHKTAAEKEDFVKQNWNKSVRASSIMMALSQLDPATMTSKIDDDTQQQGDITEELGWGEENSSKKLDW